MNNITVQISGKNILPFLKLNMESLLYFYPDIKNNIVVFDDDSNDGTKEWLENNNINRITWKYFDYEDIKKLYEPYQSNSSIYRIQCILEEIFRQQNTEKLIIMDGDQFIIKKGILEKQIEVLNSNQDVFQVKNTYMIIKPKVEYFEIYNRLTSRFPGFFTTPPNQNSMNFLINELNFDFTDKIAVELNRIHPYFLQVNLNVMKENNIFFDNASENSYFLRNKLDTGILFLEQLKLNNIPIEFQNDIIQNFVFHFVWTSSIKLIYDNIDSHKINNHHKKHMLVSYKDKFESILNKLEFDITEIYDEIQQWTNNVLSLIEGE